MTIISNLNHPSIKRIRALHQRTQRDRTKLYWIEGLRIVIEALQTGAPIDTLVLAPELLTSPRAHALVRQQRRAGVACLEVSAEVFRAISSKDGPQGLGAIIHQRWESFLPQLGASSWWIALDHAQDPGNLGTILRTSDAVGSSGIILLGNTTDPYDPQAVRASMGAIFTQRLVKTSFEQLSSWARHHQCMLVGASGDAACDYRDVAYPSSLILLLGSERHGLPPEYQQQCDALVRIPMVGRSDSLNLAVATSVVLYEVFYQHRNASATRF